ncbi:MAG TPA: tetratricopeptide repeat protein, partial [Burkholderiaceae bacterium]|nr:tetratricopeptide repeat protein [Burkholderiaceae bacterium]
RRALAIKSDYAEAHFNLGIALKAQGNLNEAVASYRRALALNANYIEAHNNLGNALRELGLVEDSLASYRLALALKPDYIEAHNSLIYALRALGRLDEAVECAGRALALKPDFAETHHNLGNVYCDLGDMDQAMIRFQKVRELDPSDLGWHAANWLAVLHYLEGDVEQCRAMLMATQQAREVHIEEYMHARNYRNYVALLVPYLEQHRGSNAGLEELPCLHVIGESHSLAAHGAVVDYRERTMRCKAEWILGCKQWHLGNDQANRFKRRFETIMADLPGHSTILLTIGEIDCRPDEGIIAVCKKRPESSLEEVARTTARGYVAYVSRINAQYGHRMIICGVPATNHPLESLEVDTAGQLIHVIRLMNATLKVEALLAGMDFLDVHALTDQGDGIASGDLHIDTIHLLPRAIVEAFARHCIKAG